MSDSSEIPWSNHPNAPQIPSSLYLSEKEVLAGTLIGAISYGIVTALFFQCMGVLLSPTNPIKKSIKLALIVHTTLMFSFLTIPAVIDLNVTSVTYIDDREFPGNEEFPPGPLGWETVLSTKALGTIFTVMFPLNQWLADGLLLHRCYVIYSMNYWVMAFPCLVYLAAVSLGIAHIYQSAGPGSTSAAANIVNVDTAYYSISLSLNVLPTLMIVIRLIVHVRNVRKATGTAGSPSGLHTTTAAIATMLVESYAIYAATLLAYVVSSNFKAWVVALFSPALGTIQVIAPYLIILRVAKRRALTSESICGTVESMRFVSQGSADGDWSLPDEDSADATETDGGAPGELVTGYGSAIEEVSS